MSKEPLTDKPRRRAPSARSLETKTRILDSAERLFAVRAYDGTSVRDIAKAAEVPVALVNFHGGSKEALFAAVVARRAEALSAARLKALETRKAQGPLDLTAVLECFIRPYLEKARSAGPQWLAYARLIAHVSADERWRDVAAQCFDPTFRLFAQEIAALAPKAEPKAVGAGFVFVVASMLSLLHSHWRIDAASGVASDQFDPLFEETLIAFCVAGMQGALKAA